VLPAATVWSEAPAPLVGAWIADARSRVEACLGFGMTRAVHVVVYTHNRDARAALDRAVPDTMLLAPVHAADHALVALHAPATDPANRDPRRMLRLLCHELVHVCVAEVTGSRKRLGDGDVDLRVASPRRSGAPPPARWIRWIETG
jgi:hypothetical protein